MLEIKSTIISEMEKIQPRCHLTISEMSIYTKYTEIDKTLCERSSWEVKSLSERVILHSDMNCFYASVEMLHHPEFAGMPLAVGGDSEARHGIVLTANYIAKKKGVKTGMALWQAK